MRQAFWSLPKKVKYESLNCVYCGLSMFQAIWRDILLGVFLQQI